MPGILSWSHKDLLFCWMSDGDRSRFRLLNWMGTVDRSMVKETVGFCLHADHSDVIEKWRSKRGTRVVCPSKMCKAFFLSHPVDIKICSRIKTLTQSETAYAASLWRYALLQNTDSGFCYFGGRKVTKSKISLRELRLNFWQSLIKWR